MNEKHLKIRANLSVGELEIEGPTDAVTEWWNKLWPDINLHGAPGATKFTTGGQVQQTLMLPGGQGPTIFGEFYTEFPADITDVDKTLVAAAFIQGQDPDRVFTTKAANQALIDQNIKVTNASQNVRRLISMKRVFVVSDGKFRVSAQGLEHINSLKVSS